MTAENGYEFELIYISFSRTVNTTIYFALFIRIIAFVLRTNEFNKQTNRFECSERNAKCKSVDYLLFLLILY